jgi:beta-barrel assembly-enhancing protease
MMPVPMMFALALALAGQAPAAPAPPAAPAATPLAALRRLDQRVATIGYRLATASIELCADRQWQPGFAIHHLSQYAAAGQSEAARQFGLGADGPAVLALAENGPAARAGLRLDDTILAADGAALPGAPAGAHDSFAPTETMLAALEAAFGDGEARLAIRRHGAPLTIDVHAVRGCASRFQLVPSAELNSHADGRWVQVTSASAEFAASDDDLAAAMAHELAHNILHHRARLNAAGVDRGLLAHFGRSARLFRQSELEADRFSIYLLDRAGYDLPAALLYWERLARRVANLIPTTHPDWDRRIAAMRAEAAAIEHAKAGGTVARPPAFEPWH